MHTLALSTLGAVLLATASIACTPALPEDQPPEDGVLSGTIDGQPWKFVAGATDKLSPESNQILATLGTEPVQDCQAHGVHRLVVKIPFKPGAYPLDLAQSVTFVSGDAELIATQGEIIVHEVTEDTIRADLHAIYDGNPDYEVSGHFVAERCFYH